MINFIPITAITSELFDRTYIEGEYNYLSLRYQEVQMAWRGYVICDEAMVDPNSAWAKASNIYSPELDSALSKSQVLYWISTRRGFNLPNSSGTSDETPSTVANGGSALCYQNKKCGQQGLTGECCPAANGVVLGCCDILSSDSDKSSTANSSSCIANEKCAAAGLEGDCCPAPGGIHLGCCDSTPSSVRQTEVSANKTESNSSSCSQVENCALLGLIGECCPTPDGVYLGCCDEQR
mmetsp:Transcript_6645/g.9874  ORF Transcript_6645/g.9874 Transcript_6645/m.9874 type:complete len:237 (+) Transcript_6645:799-1509(+)